MAVAVIEDVDVNDFPFGQAAGHHSGGRRRVEGAREDAEEVERARAASYFDLALARLGGALARIGRATRSRAGDGSTR